MAKSDSTFPLRRWNRGPPGQISQRRWESENSVVIEANPAFEIAGTLTTVDHSEVSETFQIFVFKYMRTLELVARPAVVIGVKLFRRMEQRR